jgi:hypothetical protein
MKGLRGHHGGRCRSFIAECEGRRLAGVNLSPRRWSGRMGEGQGADSCGVQHGPLGGEKEKVTRLGGGSAILDV